MRRVLSEIRETAAGGQKLVAEALVMIAAADSLATASYYRLKPTIDVSTPAPLTPGRPFVKARPDIHVAAPPNDHIAAFEREVSGCFGVMPNFFCSAVCGARPYRGTVGLREVRLYLQPLAVVCTHPKLAIEPDMLSVLEKHDRLTRLLVDPSEAERVKAPEALDRTLAELESSKASLRKSEQQLRWLASVVEFSDDAIVSKSLDGVIQSWNKGAERLFGYSAEEVIGKSITILIPPQRLAEEDTILGRIRGGHRIDHYETVRRRKDGKLLDVSLTVSPVRDAEGNVIGASKIARDITERKQERELLRRLADLMDQSHDAIFTWRMGGGIVYWSKGAERLYGYTTEEAIGRSSHELLRTRSPVPMQEIERQIAREGSWYGELTHATRDGRTVVVESRHVRVEYSGETYALETNRRHRRAESSRGAR